MITTTVMCTEHRLKLTKTSRNQRKQARMLLKSLRKDLLTQTMRMELKRLTSKIATIMSMSTKRNKLKRQ